MDSEGYVYDVNASGTMTNRSPEPVPDPMRGVLVMKALEAFRWWPEMAPLTPAERRFVMDRLAAGLRG